MTPPAARASRPQGGADAAAESAARPGGEAAASSGYVPAPVAFVSSDEDEEYGAKSDQAGYDRSGEAGSGAGSGWRDSGRAGKQDKPFDVAAGRRRPSCSKRKTTWTFPTSSSSSVLPGTTPGPPMSARPTRAVGRCLVGRGTATGRGAGTLGCVAVGHTTASR